MHSTRVPNHPASKNKKCLPDVQPTWYVKIRCIHILSGSQWSVSMVTDLPVLQRSHKYVDGKFSKLQKISLQGEI